jgi:flavin-binding protein dodecin
MAVAKVIELSAGSSESYEDAVRQAVAKASETIHNIEGVWVSEHKAVVADGEVVEFRATVRITFVVD